MKEIDADKSYELCAEIWRVISEPDATRKALRVTSPNAAGGEHRQSSEERGCRDIYQPKCHDHHIMTRIATATGARLRPGSRFDIPPIGQDNEILPVLAHPLISSQAPAMSSVSPKSSL